MKTVNAAPRLGAIYARYSSHAQNDASIEQQVEECREYAAAGNIQVVEVFADRALSGRSDKRPEFQRMMRHASAGRFTVVLAYKSNRIARNMLHALAYEDKLSKLGVDVVYCKEEFGNNAAGRFALRTMMNVNQFYSENMSEDITRGMLDCARQGKANGVPPYGYRTGEDGRFVLDEKAAPVVREIFDRASSGETLAAIADDLNARHIKTRLGGEWGRGSFRTILSNERYLGVYIWGDVRVPDGMPRIVDDVTFARVQEITRSRGMVAGRRRGGGEYILTGKLYCGLCGAPMTGLSATGGSGQTYYYYACSRQQKDHTCKKKAVRREAAEAIILGALISDVVSSRAVVDWLADRVMEAQQRRIAASPIERLRAELKGVNGAVNNVLRAIEQGIYTRAVSERLSELETRRAQLETELKIEERKITHITREDVLAWLRGFAAGALDDKTFRARLARSFLSRAYLYDDSVTLTFSFIRPENETEVITDFKQKIEAITGFASPSALAVAGLDSVACGPPLSAGANTSRLFEYRGVLALCKLIAPMLEIYGRGGQRAKSARSSKRLY